MLIMDVKMIFISIIFILHIQKVDSMAARGADVVGCGGVITSYYGNFKSPRYPDVYPNQINCIWTISVPHGFILQLNFTEFELEWGDACEYDFVEVRSSNGTLGKYCGARDGPSNQHGIANKAPPSKPIFSVDNKLDVVMSTDFSNEDVTVRGFDAHFIAIDVNECSHNNGGCSHTCHNYYGGYACSCKIGYNLARDKKGCTVQCRHIIEQQKNGIIQTPEYPNSYPPNASCEWHIVAEKGFYIHVEFLEFFIEDHHTALCPYDYLLIEDETRKIGPFCGKALPRKFKSHSNWLIIEFFSDGTEGFKGFKAQFHLEGIKCPPLRAPQNGNMTGPTNFTVKDTLQFKCHHGYKIYGSTVRTCMPNGKWFGTKPNCTRIVCPHPWNLPRNGYATDKVGGKYYVGHKLDIHCDLFDDMFGSKEMVCKKDTSWTGGDAYCIKTCGRTMIRNYLLENCPTGRYRAITKKYFQPWLVAIKYRGDLICSGMLISKDWVLTSTHCVKDMQERYGLAGQLEVILGTHHHDRLEEGAVVRKIKRSVVGRHFDYGFHTDIVLVQLSSSVPLSQKIQPICLPELKKQKNFFRAGKPVVTVGWMKESADNPTWITDRCETLIHKSKCIKHIRERHISIQKGLFYSRDGRLHKVPTELMCTNATRGTPDICAIYPGSGLVAYDKDTKKWYLGGLLSWGSRIHKHCQLYNEKHSMYTKVFKYIQWIKENTKLTDLRYPDVNDERITK